MRQEKALQMLSLEIYILIFMWFILTKFVQNMTENSFKCYLNQNTKQEKYCSWVLKIYEIDLEKY